MNWLRRGPALKLPDVWVPKFLEDLYFDLRERRLLPLVVLCLVALVAAPILLSGGGKKAPGSTIAPATGSTHEAASQGATLTVVRANPGLRAYQKRLRGRKPTDPFRQRYTAPNLKGAKLGSKGNNAFEASSGNTGATSTSTSTSTTITSTENSETVKTTHGENGVVKTETEKQSVPGSQGSQKPESGNGSGGSTEGPTGTESSTSHWIAFAVNVRIKTAVTLPEGKVETGEPVSMSGVRAPAPLPTEKAPVVTYLGANLKTGKLIVMISEEVTSVLGEGKCLMGTQTCQLLEVESGIPTTFVYGASAERYKITFTKIERVNIDLPKNLEHSVETP